MTIIEAILYGLFSGIGIETAKILHEMYIADYIRKTKELKEKAKRIVNNINEELKNENKPN